MAGNPGGTAIMSNASSRQWVMMEADEVLLIKINSSDLNLAAERLRDFGFEVERLDWTDDESAVWVMAGPNIGGVGMGATET
jgi:hypothetical protein